MESEKLPRKWVVRDNCRETGMEDDAGKRVQMNLFVKILFMGTTSLSPALLSGQCNIWDFNGVVLVTEVLL